MVYFKWVLPALVVIGLSLLYAVNNNHLVLSIVLMIAHWCVMVAYVVYANIQISKRGEED